VLLRERCAGCGEPLRLVAGEAGCGQCGTAIAAMATRTMAGDPDSIAVTTLLWGATGCTDGSDLAAGHPWRGQGTPTLLRGLWGCAQARVAEEGGLRLQGREIVEVHEALVAAWRRGGVAAPWRRGGVAAWRRGGAGAPGCHRGRRTRGQDARCHG